MSPAQANTDILVSYSAKDARWLSPLWATFGPTTDWADRGSVRDETWFGEFSQAIEAARLIVCVLSPDYLASELVRTEEVLGALVLRSLRFRRAGRGSGQGGLNQPGALQVHVGL